MLFQKTLFRGAYLGQFFIFHVGGGVSRGMTLRVEDRDLDRGEEGSLPLTSRYSLNR